ncbi:DUF397 domain-containing protein [Phytomonospora sp. NPDC050363]|uniref:DUF397 domain-containing protein n=1 Tax=Phytomonospora sp. NPDC050363 TaxID=3155642 RepID=UPI0033E8E4B7
MSQLVWRKSSRSGTNGGNCIEAAYKDSVLIRDSKLAASPACPVLAIDRETWRGFLATLPTT